MEGYLLPACSCLAHLQPGDGASAAAAACHSKRALEKSLTHPTASLLEPWFSLRPEKLSFEVGLGYRLKQTLRAHASCRGAEQGGAEHHAAASTAGSFRGPKLGPAPGDSPHRHAATAGHYLWWVHVSPCSCLEKDNALPSVFPWFRSRLTCSSAGWSRGGGPSPLRPLGVFGFAFAFHSLGQGLHFPEGVLTSVHGWSFAEVALTLPLWPLARGWVSAGHPATSVAQR